MTVPSPNISVEAQDIVLELSQGRTCSCGHSVSHVMVGPDADYRLLDRMAMSVIGVSRPPIKLRFRCRVCDGVLVETKDPVVLDSFH